MTGPTNYALSCVNMNVMSKKLRKWVSLRYDCTFVATCKPEVRRTFIRRNMATALHIKLSGIMLFDTGADVNMTFFLKY